LRHAGELVGDRAGIAAAEHSSAPSVRREMQAPNLPRRGAVAAAAPLSLRIGSLYNIMSTLCAYIGEALVTADGVQMSPLGRDPRVGPACAAGNIRELAPSGGNELAVASVPTGQRNARPIHLTRTVTVASNLKGMLAEGVGHGLGWP
jgi:hypothetical protein